MNYEIIDVSTQAQMQEAFSVRRTVFIEEQEVPEALELDEHDDAGSTIHILARDERGRAVGTARFRSYHADDETDGEGTARKTAKIERVAVVASHRGTGLGRMLMERLEAEVRLAGFRIAKLNAQTHAQVFYERIGYQSHGSPFMEAGIEHIAMDKRL